MVSSKSMQSTPEVPLVVQVFSYGFAVLVVLGGLTYPENREALQRWVRKRREQRRQKSLGRTVPQISQRPNQTPQHNAGLGPATLDGASPPRPALSSEETAGTQSPRG
jgi:hypothetical protein